MKDNRKASFSPKMWMKLMPIVMRYKRQLIIIIVSNMLLAGIDLIIPLLQSRAVDEFIMKGTTAGFGAVLYPACG